MISVIFSYTLPAKKSQAEMLEMFKHAEPMFKGMQGLKRKTFCYDEASGRGMSLYQWDSEPSAAICFSPGFLQKFEEAFGTKPQISKMPILFAIEN